MIEFFLPSYQTCLQDKRNIVQMLAHSVEVLQCHMLPWQHLFQRCSHFILAQQ